MISSNIKFELADETQNFLQALSAKAILECLTPGQRSELIQELDLDEIWKEHEDALRERVEKEN